MPESTAILVLSMAVWPPEKTIELVSLFGQEVAITILADTHGRFMVRYPAEASILTFYSQKVEIIGNGFFILSVEVQETGADFYVNSQHILTFDKAFNEVITITTTPLPPPEMYAYDITLNLDTAEQNPEISAFLAALGMLASNIYSSGIDREKIKFISNLIKLLLLEPGLIRLANHTKQVDIAYQPHVSQPPGRDYAMHFSQLITSGINVRSLPKISTLDFLNTPIITTSNRVIPIGYFITACSNQDENSFYKATQEDIDLIDNMISYQFAMVVQAITSIGKLVLVAAKPLVDALDV
jgi:hypothetical protein